MVRQETWTYNTWFGKCSIHYAYSYCITIQLYDVIKFDSTVVIYVFTSILSPNLNNQILKNFEAQSA